MTAAEGKALLDFLLEHGHRPEFTFRFRWQKGSIAFWDNRSTKHIALGDTGPFRRLMRRVQIGGAGSRCRTSSWIASGDGGEGPLAFHAYRSAMRSFASLRMGRISSIRSSLVTSCGGSSLR